MEDPKHIEDLKRTLSKIGEALAAIHTIVETMAAENTQTKQEEQNPKPLSNKDILEANQENKDKKRTIEPPQSNPLVRIHSEDRKIEQEARNKAIFDAAYADEMSKIRQRKPYHNPIFYGIKPETKY